MRGGTFIPPSHRINLAVPFTPQTLGFDFFKEHQRHCAAIDIKFGVRWRHTHNQMDIIAKKDTVTREQIQADEQGFDCTFAEFCHVVQDRFCAEDRTQSKEAQSVPQP